MNELLAELADILEVDEVKPDTNFTKLPECDSLSMLSIIVALDSKYGVNVTASQVRAAGTGQQLYELVSRMKH